MTRAAAQPRRSALECLDLGEPCLGAAFCSYTFDPFFFEAQVLRAVLDLKSDPDEQLLDFLHEGRRRLQEVPVACFVDEGARTPGQRLPYDLRLIHGRVFHPKLALLLARSHALLLLGSGNLTRGGYGDNTELWIPRRLDFDDPEGAEILREILDFLAGVERLAGPQSQQLALLRAAILGRLTAASPAPARGRATRSLQVLHSLTTPILPAFLELLPEDATILRVGALAPFFERDDEDAAGPDGIDSILRTLLDARPSKGAIVDLGFGYAGGPLTAPPTTPALEDVLGALWIHRHPGEPARLEYFTPLAFTAKRLRWRDARHKDHVWPLEDVRDAHASRQLYLAAPPIANGPARIVEALAARHEVRAWLLPALRPDGERVVRRPLHAKLLTITVRRRGKVHTFVLVGSPNASRRALLHPPPHGNVELAMAMVFDRDLTLADLAPELIACPLDQITLQDPIFPATGLAALDWIADVVHDPRARDLRITWAEPDGVVEGAFRLTYLDRVLAEGTQRPAGELVVADFDLHPTSCEVTLEVEGALTNVPIRITDLAGLASDPVEHHYDLAELIALLGRRIGRDRLRFIATKGGPGAARTTIEAIFGDGFTPTDIFRAWANLARQLGDDALSLAAFRHLLRGPVGVEVTWQRMREAAGGELPIEVTWYYGAELLKTLTELALPEGPDRSAKLNELDALLRRLSDDVAALAPRDDGEHPWLAALVHFYNPYVRVTASHAAP